MSAIRLISIFYIALKWKSYYRIKIYKELLFVITKHKLNISNILS